MQDLARPHFKALKKGIAAATHDSLRHARCHEAGVCKCTKLHDVGIGEDEKWRTTYDGETRG